MSSGDDAAPLTLKAVALEEVGGDDSDDAIERLLASDVSPELRQKRAARLIHALAANPELFEGRGLKLRRKAVKFVEEAFDRQSKQWGLATEGEDFERISAMAALPASALRRIADAADQLVSLASLETARGELQRTYNVYKPLLSPMVPAPLVRGKLTELLNAVSNVREAEGPAFLVAHARATDLLAEFSRDVDDAGALADASFSRVIERLGNLLDQAFDGNPATEPATLEVLPVGKKYPLATEGAAVRVALRVSNRGPGQALDVRFEDLESSGLRLETRTIPFGTVMPNDSVTPSISGVAVGDDCAIIEGRIVWTNSDGSEQTVPLDLTVESQRADIAWDRLRQRYDLEPVRTEQELVGRGEMLRELVDLVGDRRIGSAFVTGQKRVGKTSIALTFQSHFEDDEEVVVIYLEAGAYIQPTAEATIGAMGEAIAVELAAADDRFGDVDIPTFETTLAGLKGVVGQMRKRSPKLRVVIVLDEFDELPVDMYRRGAVGDAFFVALRTLAGQEHIGFILVGGEKMGSIIDAQGDQLNKFESVQVTYLDRERHWDDFCDLVRRPVNDCFEITDEAVVALFDHTAGHPYFTKLVCRALFKLAVARRDAHITAPEIHAAADDALRGANVTNFIHFWEDGVLEAAEKVEDVSVRRRKVLLAYAECRERGLSDPEAIIAQARTYGLGESETRETLREFERRRVLEMSGGVLRAVVRVFDTWLARYGVSAITTTFTDPDAILNAKLREQELRVKPEELSDLVATWGQYRGRDVTADEVRAWLNQFEEVRQQRLMFDVLRAVRFYDAGRIRSKLREGHGIAVRGVRQRLESGRTKRNEYVVSYLGGPAKSGARYARLYADENNIYATQVLELGKLNEALAHDSVQALVIVDDFIGSGNQAIEHLNELDKQVGGLIRKREIKVVFIALTGFASSAHRVTKAIEELGLPAEIHLCDPLGEGDRCFSDESEAFDEAADRVAAREIAESYGRRLQRRHPLGYDDSQAVVVFDESCPNGTLPILWDANDGWRPLFARVKGR